MMASKPDARGLALPQWATGIVGIFELSRDALCPVPYPTQAELTLADRAIAAGLAIVAAIYAVVSFSTLDSRLYESWNIFFHADGIRVLADMTERLSDQWRTNAHPLVPLLTYPLMQVLMGLGLSKLGAAGVLTVACAAATMGMLFLALRNLGLPRAAASAFAVMFLGSATFVHWFAYVETYTFAMVSLSLVLWVLTNSRSQPLWLWTIAGAGALSITITNWALHLACSFFRLPFWSFARTVAVAFLLVAVLAVAQKAAFPQARLFFNILNLKGDIAFSQIWQEKKGLATWTPLDNVRGILLTSAVAPPPGVEVNKTTVGDFTIVSNLHSPLAQMSPAGVVALSCWILLLGAGFWGVIASVPHRAVAVPIAIYVVFQVLMHMVYGEIAFLYAGNVFPALLLMTAFGYFTRLRRIVLGAAVAVAVLGGFSNYAEFQTAARLSRGIAAHLETTGTAICVPTCSTPADAARSRDR